MNPLPLFLIPVLASAGAIYNITDLGSLGGAQAQAFGLSSNGQAVGAASTMFGYTHAFSSFGSGMTDLSTTSEGIASGVNAAGQIVGTQFSGGQAVATTWTNGVAQAFGGAGSYGLAINDPGQMAGMNSAGHAFRTVNGAMQDLGALSGGTWTSAYAINNAGAVAGYGDTPGGFRAFAWSAGSGYTVLGTFGGANSYAMAISDTGSVAGSAQLASGYVHAFLWSGGSLQDLGTLGSGSSYAYGINNAGEVVGYSGTHAFLFANGVMLDLNNLIDPASGWELTEAYAINASGQIAGGGLLNGVEHAFRLDTRGGKGGADVQGTTVLPADAVPEPATWIAVLSGLAIIVRSRPPLRRPLPARR